PSDTPGSLLADFCRTGKGDEAGLRRAVSYMANGTPKTDQKHADIIQRFWDSDTAGRAACFEDYKSVFLKVGGDVKALSKMATGKITNANPEIADIIMAEAERTEALLRKIKSLGVAAQSFNLLLVGGEIVKLYENIKSLNIQLDYDDLIHYTRRLLTESGQAGWVLYKMDQGIDHILVDEAQDTSPDQWEVIRALASEFFSGQAARDDITRTIFVVGDEKQSIFSFQGADPAGFQVMRRYFSERVQAAAQQFSAVNLLMSFRSAPAVLSAVDHVFSLEMTAQGVHTDLSEPLKHLPFRAGEAGLVELWPLIPGSAGHDLAPWTPAIEAVAAENANMKLADKIAETIAGWLDRGEMLEAKNRPIRAGDILILFRSRTALLDHVVRALKQHRIPVSGIDRIVLTNHLAVQDCLAMAECALLPDDDLTLATILKSPFIGYDEEQLYQLAYGRSGSLWQDLKDFDPAVYSYLQCLTRDVQTHTPYDFLQQLLVRACPGDPVSGRRALYARLGLEINDAIDELLNICLDYQSMHNPNLQKFLFWFRQGQAEVKREQESSSANQVRLMTVHASKGLQAPIVFLPDTIKVASNKPLILWPADERGLPLWAPREAQRDHHCTARIEQQKIKTEEESRRLLYVALTRAEDRLYICGAQEKNKPSDKCWYQLCRMMLQNMNGVQTFDFTLGDSPVIDTDSGQPLEGLRYISAQTKDHEDDKENITADRLPLPPVPNWILSPPPPEPSPPRPLAPSRPSDPEPAIRSPLQADDSWRFSRGNLVHQLLEILPQLPAARQQNACRAYLGKPAHGLNQAQQEELTAEIIAVLNHPEFAPIFGPDSRAEVPVVGLLDKQAQSDYYAISGQIDRMVVEADRILIIDYKTNRPPPEDESAVPDIYWRQMAAYQTALAHIYPGKTIECALLWTDGPRLMPLSADRLAKFKKA
ncbi:MAG: double-strand break repair helicase AddA, partial [Pseudomonadota bacterium]